MTYRVYIKKDYKTKVERIGGTPNHSYFFKIVCFVVIVISAGFLIGTGSSDRPEPEFVISSVTPNSDIDKTPIVNNIQITNLVTDNTQQQNINEDATFDTQPELFISTASLEHPLLHALDDTEALLDWSKIERHLSSIYDAKTGRPSYRYSRYLEVCC